LVASRSTAPLVKPIVEEIFRCEPTCIVCSSRLAAKGICLCSPFLPFAVLSVDINFSTRLRIEISFCSEKSPEAETRRAVMLSSASDRGDWAAESSSEK
jgi:hypothetical protein